MPGSSAVHMRCPLAQTNVWHEPLRFPERFYGQAWSRSGLRCPCVLWDWDYKLCLLISCSYCPVLILDLSSWKLTGSHQVGNINYNGISALLLFTRSAGRWAKCSNVFVFKIMSSKFQNFLSDPNSLISESFVRVSRGTLLPGCTSHFTRIPIVNHRNLPPIHRKAPKNLSTKHRI